MDEYYNILRLIFKVIHPQTLYTFYNKQIPKNVVSQQIFMAQRISKFLELSNYDKTVFVEIFTEPIGILPKNHIIKNLISLNNVIQKLDIDEYYKTLVRNKCVNLTFSLVI